MAVLRGPPTPFTSGFIARGAWVRFFLNGLDHPGDGWRAATGATRALLQPVVSMPQTVNEWRPEIDRVIREEFPCCPWWQTKKANLYGLWSLLFSNSRPMYALMGFSCR